jgi:hypothetical protein
LIKCEAVHPASKQRSDLSIILSSQAEEQYSDEDSVLFELASLLEPKHNSEPTKGSRPRKSEAEQALPRPLSTAISTRQKPKKKITSPRLVHLSPLQYLSPVQPPRKASEERMMKVLSRKVLLRNSIERH